MSAYIHRSLESQLLKMQDTFPVILLSGARQAGKSTLLQYMASSRETSLHEVSLDDMLERRLAAADPALFLRTHEPPLIIDEFQYAPELLSYIKIEIDRARRQEMFEGGSKTGTRYFLTGSQVFQTMEHVSESLAGRIGIMDLHPLSTRELHEMQDDIFVPDIAALKNRKRVPYESTAKLFERIHRGSYPELYKNRDFPLEAFFSSYVRTYLERDIRSLIQVQDETRFVKFISSVAARTGQEYNASDIAKDVEISPDTAGKWMAILTATYLVFLLPPYRNSAVGRIIKRPKMYFMDTGLACYLAGYMDARTLEKSAYSGQIFETYVISEIVKSYTNSGRDPRKHLFYYRDSNRREIDLLVLDGDRIFPVEIKKSANPSRDAIRHFSAAQHFEVPSPGGIVLCMCESVHALDEKNYLVPIEYI